MIAAIPCDCFHHRWLMPLSMIAVISCDCCQRRWLLPFSPIARRLLADDANSLRLLSSPAIAIISCDCCHRRWLLPNLIYFSAEIAYVKDWPIISRINGLRITSGLGQPIIRRINGLRHHWFFSWWNPERLKPVKSFHKGKSIEFFLSATANSTHKS